MAASAETEDAVARDAVSDETTCGEVIGLGDDDDDDDDAAAASPSFFSGSEERFNSVVNDDVDDEYENDDVDDPVSPWRHQDAAAGDV